MKICWRAGAEFVFLLTFAPLLHASVEVTAFEMTVAELPRAVSFYTGVLQFQLVRQEVGDGQKAAWLRLGEETLILREYAAKGRAILRDLPANDRSFEHLAIVVVEMDLAYARLVQSHTRIESAGVQRLPDWNFDAAGIRAVYFRDPDGHFLELISFSLTTRANRAGIAGRARFSRDRSFRDRRLGPQAEHRFLSRPDWTESAREQLQLRR